MKQILTAVALLAGSCVSTPADEPRPKPSAADLLSAGQVQAKKEGQRVFLVFGSPGCGWCKVFDRYHADPAVARVTARHFVLVKVDVVENAGGQELYRKYGSDRGVPAWAVLSAGGEVLADSGDRKDNVGFPAEPHEVAHYLKALKKSCPRLTDAETELLTAKLKEARAKK